MEKKKLKITHPKGYEIDRENSTFECIKFKPITENLTYEEIFNSLFKGCAIDITMAYKDLNNKGINLIQVTESKATYSERQYKKILAINQLFNIAKYYNGDWKPDWNEESLPKYCIVYNKQNGLEIDTWYSSNYGIVCFKREADAQEVIDNPNFREILDTIFKQ